MKIGQVTMCGDNYGACLQAYALQKVCLDKGYDIELIKYHQEDRGENISLSKIQKVRKLGFKGVVKYIKERQYIELRKNAYREFRNDNLIFHNEEFYRNDESLKKLNDEFDCFICGSDMIWSEEFTEDWNFFFLEFAEKGKKFSYAPSFGKNNLNDNNKKKVKEYLQDFNKLSCRENGGVRLIESLGILNVKQVIDPTMLLSKEEWEQCITNKNRVIREPYVFAYLFGAESIERFNFFECVEKKIAKMYTLPKFTKKDQNSFPINGIGPMDFLRLFRDAEFIVTDTFHGLMFSIIFRKPFVVLERQDGSNWAKYSDRMISALEMFGLKDRYIDANFKELEKMRVLNYDKYESLIRKAQIESFNYLNDIFKEVNNG